MSLEPYLRGSTWWVRGYVEHNGRRISDYIRQSTGSSTEAGAKDWCEETIDRHLRRHLMGDANDRLTFNEQVMLYNATPDFARLLLKVLPHLGHRFADTITPKEVKNLGPILYPNTSTDTWHRHVVCPVRAVINNAHEMGKGPPIRIRPYTRLERVSQDVKRGKGSRGKKTPSDKAWIDAFCAHADPHNAALVRFMFETGARVGQAVALLPKHLDLKNCRVWLGAAKGHDAQWVLISQAMVDELRDLPPKRPFNRKTGELHPPRVFGYATNSSYKKAWTTICAKAGIEFLGAHAAGRHGFYTELRVRQGVDALTAAKAGRWADASLPDRVYGHPETPEADLRELFRTNRVQGMSNALPTGLKNKEKKA